MRNLIDGRAAACEICHHLLRHRLRIGRHVARRDAMIAGKNRNRDPLELRTFATLPSRQPGDQVFETAETPRRLGERLLPPDHGSSGVLVAIRQIATERANVV